MDLPFHTVGSTLGDMLLAEERAARELGIFHDALRAKEAAEDTAKSLRRIFGLPELPCADVKNARPNI